MARGVWFLTPVFSVAAQSVLLLLVSSRIAVASSSGGSGECGPTVDNISRRWSFSVLRFRNESGGWVNFTSTREQGESSSSDDAPSLHLSEILFECDGKKFISLQGTLRDHFSGAKLDDKLKFHRITGPNTALINKGYTVVKLRLDDHGVVLTNRPLRTGELFEVRMDKRGTAKGHANGIGITTRKPEEGGLPNHMNNLKTGTWLLYGTNIWINSKEAISKYTESSIYDLKAGDRMGVMKTETGALHFFVNGVDQGPAASNIPEEVYGVYELYGDATQATIVHTTQP